MDGMEKIKPQFSLPASMLPEIKNWKVNQKYKIVLTVIQKSVGEKPYGNKEIEARFEIVSAKEANRVDMSKIDKKQYVKVHAKAMKGQSVEYMDDMEQD